MIDLNILPELLSPKVSVITVVFNSKNLIKATLESVINQTYKNLEYLVVDGNSNDGTSEIINFYSLYIARHIREPDKGIYDAMNKGIRLASGNWVVFMNAGDIFADDGVLSNIFSVFIPQNIKFLYSDFIVSGKEKDNNKLYNADYKRGVILHQSVIYQKELHLTYGYYLVTKKIIISDYLFFNSVPEEMIVKTDIIISINNGEGISQGSWCYYQKKCADYIFGRINLSSLFKSILLFQLKQLILAIPGISKTRAIIRWNKNISKVSILDSNLSTYLPKR